MRHLTLIFLILAACSNEPAVFFPEPPEGFPAMDFPEDNAYSPARFELGRKLFFDPRLSADGSLSCATCHVPSLAFTDQGTVAMGIGQTEGTRNTPTLTNVGFKRMFFAEGGVRELERTINPPLESPHEMNMQMRDLMAALNADDQYVHLFSMAYDTTPSPSAMTHALATYMRRIVSWNSNFDRSRRGEHPGMRDDQKRGWEIFQKRRCDHCHTPPLFSDLEFHHIPLDSIPTDPGRGRLTRRSEDMGSFQTPTLRNIQVTGPYFHDGREVELENAILHPWIDDNGNTRTPELPQEEQRYLVLFLRSLTDSAFLNSPIWYPLQEK
ncbi:MAG: hypothetical protein LPK47_07470 [Bacteroidota bacterium]|nr:hypothetical protein [Bacteroidota bacterium]